MDLSNNEVTKEPGYKEFVLENFTRTIISLDGYGKIKLASDYQFNFNFILIILEKTLIMARMILIVMKMKMVQNLKVCFNICIFLKQKFLIFLF